MKRVNFITNQPLERQSGGWCGISRGLFSALQDKAPINFVGPIEPAISISKKLLSKGLRLSGLRGDFFYFSTERLKKISNQVIATAPNADFDLFFGATSWISCIPNRPYGVFVDALFPTYLRVYGRPTDFHDKDLERIRCQEEAWLGRASHIFWTSDWARRDGNKYEYLKDVPGSIVGVSGNLAPPILDTFVGEKRILFVAMRFQEKGGYEAFEAFTRLHKTVPDLKFVVIGERPPESVSKHPGVEIVGLLDKGDEAQLARLRMEISRAFCLVHPTRMDMTPCILIEAAYWGCPVIAPARFGIPEIIENKVTGYLLPESFIVDDIVDRIEQMLNNENTYSQMRCVSRSRALECFTYDVIAEKILTAIDNSLSV